MGLRAMNKKLDEQRESDWRDNMAFDVMRELIRREDFNFTDADTVVRMSVKLTDALINELSKPKQSE